MKHLLVVGLLAGFLVVFGLATGPAYAQEAGQTLVTETGIGSVAVTLPDGTVVNIPSDLVQKVGAALESDDVESALAALIEEASDGDANVVAALAAFAASLRPDLSGPITVAAMRALPAAGDLIVQSVAGVPGVDRVLLLAYLEPGGAPPPIILPVVEEDIVSTAENPAQTAEPPPTQISSPTQR